MSYHVENLFCHGIKKRERGSAKNNWVNISLYILKKLKTAQKFNMALTIGVT